MPHTVLHMPHLIRDPPDINDVDPGITSFYKGENWASERVRSQTACQSQDRHPGRESSKSGFLPSTRCPDCAGELRPQLETTVASQARPVLGRGEGLTAHRGRHMCRGLSQTARLSFPWGVPATPQIFPSTNSGKEVRNCILGYTFLWRTRPSR